jgi:very-short-patch-repair endonuclease
MREKVASRDGRVAEIAAQQHGVISQAQLIGAGLSTSTISRSVESGRLHRIHRGVYAVGHPGLSLYGRWLAAALAYGDRAAVSHRSAAELWGLLQPIDSPIDISVPGDGGRARRSGLRLHRRTALPPAAMTRRYGIPVTKPAQTIVDLRGAVPPRELRRAIRQANVLGLPIGSEASRDRTRSELEREFLHLCRKYGLPAPEVNVRIGPHLVDFFWRERRLVVETDGFRYHRGRQAFEDDRSRDLDLRSLGCDVLHFSYRQVSREPKRVVATVHDALST